MKQQRHSVKQIIADFKLLVAGKDEYCLLQPLRDWMKLLLRYEFYSVEELVSALRQRIRVWQWTAEETVLLAIGHRCHVISRICESKRD